MAHLKRSAKKIEVAALMILEDIVSTLGDVIFGMTSGDYARRSKQKKKRDLIVLCIFGAVIISAFAAFFCILEK